MEQGRILNNFIHQYTTAEFVNISNSHRICHNCFFAREEIYLLFCRVHGIKVHPNDPICQEFSFTSHNVYKHSNYSALDELICRKYLDSCINKHLCENCYFNKKNKGLINPPEPDYVLGIYNNFETNYDRWLINKETGGK